MAKNKLTDWSTTAASNTDIGGIGIEGSSAVQNFDNAEREMMAQLAKVNAGTDPVSDTWSFGNAADLTRKFRFSAAGISAATTRTFTMPDVSGTLAVSGGTFVIKQSTGPTPTDEGDLQWDTDDDALAIGNGSTTKIIPTLPASVVSGDIFYATSDRALARLAKGTGWQILRMNQAETAPLWGDRISTGTATSATGTAVDFTSIPSGVRRVNILFDAVSLDGSGHILVQLGDSGGFETSGYDSTSATLADGAAIAVTDHTAGFIVRLAAASGAVTGSMSIEILAVSTFNWVSRHSCKTGTQIVASGGGSKALSAELTQVRVTRNGGSFDGGTINVSWE